MSEKFSIVNTLDLRKLTNEIDLFIARTKEKNPYIFMSDKTIEAIYEENKISSHMLYKSQPNKMVLRFDGHKVFEDDELEFGEIEIR